MTQVCSPIPVPCIYCYTYQAVLINIINVPAGLTPGSSPYIWVMDKFGNQFQDNSQTVSLDGSINIDTSKFPKGMFNEWAGNFDVFVTSDQAGINLLQLSIGIYKYSCVLLNITC